MSNTANNANTNLYNVCSLEHCYTNLFALTDLTGIKWLRLRVKEKQILNSNTNQKKKKSSNSNNNNNMFGDQDDEDDDDDDDDDDEEDDEENEDDENLDQVSSTPKKDTQNQSSQNNTPSSNNQFSSQIINTTSINDPILTTHAKCLNEDILCSWKRVVIMQSTNKDEQNILEDEHNDPEIELLKTSNDQITKELWIFWYEKEEPPNLASLISPDLIPFDTTNQSNANTSQTNQMNTSSINNTASSILKQAQTSNNGLPYECRSMLFKALHNLIEKSLIEKGKYLFILYYKF
jgi:hypothetical protein